MISDILAVFVVTLVSSLFLPTTYVHGFPISPSTLRYIRRHPSADLYSSLRLLRHHPIPSIDYDLGGDISQMLIGESSELSTINDQDDHSSFLDSSLHASHEPFEFYRQPLSSKSLSRKLLLLKNQHQQKEEDEQQEEEEQQQQEKRSPSPLMGTSPSLPTQFNFNPAIASGAYADPSHAKNIVNFSQLNESTRLSPSLKLLVETNPLARAWLTLLLQKVMEEQQVPYIFKYGRRRKK
ncbi:unnamed protein product [Rotaria sp. Silwood1]|nr:unnamed protein product [Rotaria sp. Silwood1]CAF4579105.1 unnamed protein product [Rotaria sp. Silwood1]